MNDSLPRSGLASDLDLPQIDPADPARLSAFVQAVGPAARVEPAPTPVLLHTVLFRLDEDLYALPIERVREVVRVEALTRVPQAPEHVRGIQSLRGAVLPVLELKTRLGLAPAVVGHASRILVCESGDRLLGLLVDAVARVVRVPRSEVQPPPPELRGRMSAYIAGVLQLDGRSALLLDIDRLLVLPEQPQDTASAERGEET